MAVAAKARSINANSPAPERLTLEQMRSRLLTDITKFHRQASKFVPASVVSEAIARAPLGSPIGPGWDRLDEEETVDRETTLGSRPPSPDNDVDEGDSASPRDVSQTPPERLTICLPSHLGIDVCTTHNLNKLVEAERKLRVGQMNDALHRVRVAVGYKSVLYRTTVRHSATHRQKLRSFDDVHLVQADVLASARLYTAARESYTKLYKPGKADDDAQLAKSLEKYKVLEKADLKANTALIEHSVRGVSRAHLPWFWGLGMDAASRDEGWSGERK